MQAFLRDFILRPSCYQCPAKSGKSGADITIGDFWGIENVLPEFDDDKGCGLVLDYDEHVERIDSSEWKFSTYSDALAGNFSITTSVKLPLNRNFYFYRIGRNRSCIKTLEELDSKNWLRRAYRVLYRNLVK